MWRNEFQKTPTHDDDDDDGGDVDDDDDLTEHLAGPFVLGSFLPQLLN